MTRHIPESVVEAAVDNAAEVCEYISPGAMRAAINAALDEWVKCGMAQVWEACSRMDPDAWDDSFPVIIIKTDAP